MKYEDDSETKDEPTMGDLEDVNEIDEDEDDSEDEDEDEESEADAQV